MSKTTLQVWLKILDIPINQGGVSKPWFGVVPLKQSQPPTVPLWASKAVADQGEATPAQNYKSHLDPCRDLCSRQDYIIIMARPYHIFLWYYVSIQSGV